LVIQAQASSDRGTFFIVNAMYFMKAAAGLFRDCHCCFDMSHAELHKVQCAIVAGLRSRVSKSEDSNMLFKEDVWSNSRVHHIAN
jgi:hypothetical protein